MVLIGRVFQLSTCQLTTSVLDGEFQQLVLYDGCSFVLLTGSKQDIIGVCLLLHLLHCLLVFFYVLDAVRLLLCDSLNHFFFLHLLSSLLLHLAFVEHKSEEHKCHQDKADNCFFV